METEDPKQPSIWRCQQCGALVGPKRSMLDSRNDRTVLVFECDCGLKSWSSEWTVRRAATQPG